MHGYTGFIHQSLLIFSGVSSSSFYRCLRAPVKNTKSSDCRRERREKKKRKKKKWKEKTMSRGFDRVTDVWQLKIVQLFGAVRIPRRSFRTVLRPFFVFPFIFILPFPSLFFSHFASSSCVPAFGHTRPPPVSNQLLASWRNPRGKIERYRIQLYHCSFRIFSNRNFSFFFFFYFNSIFFFYYKNPVILFILRGIVERDEINFK